MNPSDTLVEELKSTGDFADLAAFVAVVGAGSFTAAAKRSGTDKSQLSRRVKALEERLGVRLLTRTTRSLNPTEAGQRLYDQALGPLTNLLHATSEARDADHVQGVVRIGGPAWLADEVWQNLVREVQRHHPGLELDLRLSDHFQDFVGEGFDLALRLGNLPDSELIARRIAKWGYVLVASPEWAERHADIAHPDDVANHWIEYGRSHHSPRWRFVRSAADGTDASATIRVRGMVSVDHGFTLLTLVEAGIGAVALPTFLVWKPLQEGRLVRILPDWRPDHEHSVFLVSADRKYIPKRVLTVVEILERVCADAEVHWETARTH